MNPKSLCFVLPTEFDESDDNGKKLPAKKPPGRGCGAVAVDFLRHSLHRFFHAKWVNFCHQNDPRKQFSGAAFVDADGVPVHDEVRGVGADENPRIFSYSELYIGSNGFNDSQVLGSGGFGRVYRAVLPSDGTAVAVKCLAESGESFEKTFMAELVAVAHLRHRNLVRLRGWCVHDDQLLLVYDYMPNRSLDRVLFKKSSPDSTAPLNWDRRKNIINGLAAALNYLHEHLETQIIHRDVKTSNVMLDSHFNARLGDFGLARWLEHDLQYSTAKTTPLLPPTMSVNNRLFRLAETTRIGGTIGYLPPESFQKRSVATAKSDVFSFGIVVLEVVCGRRAVDLTYPDDRIVLLDWIRRLSDDGTLLEAGDIRLRDGSYGLSDMERFLHLGLMCTLHDPQSRPSMKWVVEVLTGDVYDKLPDLPSFQSHPLYISLSSSTTSASNTGATKSSMTSTDVSTTAFYCSDFVSANAETIYLSAESDNNPTIPSRGRPEKAFPMVETPRVITFEEIVSATNNFSDSRRIAEVDFGTAYYGVLNNHQQVIIKRLGMKTCPALRMRFVNEFQNMGRLRHRNLLQLRGWCTEQGETLVIYDYSASRRLSHVLFHSQKWESTLHWRQRYNIIQSLASAVCYLHEEWDEQVIHRNITSSAIILDHDTNPRLGSFALAEFLTRNEDGHHVVFDKRQSVRGIFGYLSPEYIDSGEATTKADVYSFGVVLFEVVTGQMAVDFRRNDVLLVERVHASEAQRRSYTELADWRLDGQYDRRELARLVNLGMACTHSDPESRPSMRQIASILDGRDRWLTKNIRKGGMEEWRQRNACSLGLIRRIKALGIQ